MIDFHQDSPKEGETELAVCYDYNGACVIIGFTSMV